LEMIGYFLKNIWFSALFQNFYHHGTYTPLWGVSPARWALKNLEYISV